MRIGVFAYHNLGEVCLRTLHSLGHEIAYIFTHHDDPNENCWFASVADMARRLGIEPHFGRPFRPVKPVDAVFSAGYRHIIPGDILDHAPAGAYNLHPSLLPKYRGRCPINWAIINGETETGVTLHHMVRRVDAGDIVAQERVPILPMDTAADVHFATALIAAVMLRRVLKAATWPLPGTPMPKPLPPAWPGRRPEDGELHEGMTKEQMRNMIRAVAPPYPGAFVWVGGHKLFVRAVQ